MLKKKGFSTSFPNEDLIDNNQETISNFKIKKEDFLLDFDDTYEQLNMATPKGKIIIQGQENHSPFSLKSFSNLSFDYNRPLSPKTHILNIQDNNNNYSPILKRVNKTISPSLVSSTNRFKNSFSCSSSSPSSSSSSSSSSSPRLISTPPIISTPSSPMILTSSLDKFDEILSENEFMSLDNSVTSSPSSSSSPIIIKTNTTTSTKIITPSSSPSSSYIEDAPSTPSPSKLFQSLSFKSPCSSPSSSSSSSTTTTTPKSSINGGNIIKKQLFSNKRIQDIKIEKPSTKIDLHPSKLQIKSNLKIKPSLPYNSTEVTANTKTTTTTTTTTTNTTIPTLSKNIIKRTSSVGLSPTLSSTQLVNKSSRKSISATTTTTTITPHNNNNNNNNNSTTTTKTPSKRSLDTSNLSTPKSTSSTINKAFTTSTTPLKKPRMSMTPLSSSSSSSSTTPSKFINPLPSSSSSSSKTPTTITNSKRLSTLSKPSPITPITPTPTITKTTTTTTSTTSTTTPNKPTNKRLSTLVNTAQKPRKSYAPPPSSHISDELEQRIQEALLAEANGNYTGGSVLTHSSPQKVEQSEWSPIRKKSTLHDVHACTKKNY
ncbi:hypothetical protein ACTFIW_003472 [Dictyostelium discoideum]